MDCFNIHPKKEWEVIASTPRSQAATMVLEKGERTGGPRNKHEDSDQWMYVISGKGSAIVKGTKKSLESGSLLLITAGEAHEIINEESTAFKTLNFYAPKEY